MVQSTNYAANRILSFRYPPLGCTYSEQRALKGPQCTFVLITRESEKIWHFCLLLRCSALIFQVNIWTRKDCVSLVLCLNTT